MTDRIQDLPLSYIERSEHEARDLPVIVMIHGRGADAADLVDLGPMIGTGYRYLFPDAPRPFEPMPLYRYGLTWFDGLPPEESSFRESRDLLVAWLQAVSERYATPLTRFLIAGFSQGGVMALDVAFRITPAPAGAIVMSGALHESDAPDFAGNRAIPVCMVHGIGDEILPVQYARRARAVLETAGLAVDYGEFEMAHHVTLESMNQVRHFAERVLPPAEE